MADAKDRARDLGAALSPKHRAFADNVLMGMSYVDAYMAIYDDDPDHPLDRRTGHANSSRLLGNRKVRAYIEAVSEASVDEIIINRAELMASLRDVALSGVLQGPGAGARVSAAKILLDQLTPGGEQKTVKHQVSGPDGQPVVVETRKGLDSAQIEQIKRDLLGIK